MKSFSCICGNTLYFENSACLVCGRAVGFLPDIKKMRSLEEGDEGDWHALPTGGPYRKCFNYSNYEVCNWMVPVSDGHVFCLSCRMNRVIPNLDRPDNLTLWYRIETAKRRLFYTLLELRLPIIGRDQDQECGLGFEFLADSDDIDEFSNEVVPQHQVMTGHRTGIITINVKEAEDSAREQMREMMNERYRTLLGHFRHEIGHYYWDRLVRDGGFLEDCRAVFGDERIDYAQALARYYQKGPPADWEWTWISAYASSHPWEDWAETWAHYLHMVDTLETAQDCGFSIEGRRLRSLQTARQLAPGHEPDASFEKLISDWNALTVALNALNRSMGLSDAYPFTLTGAALDKLRFVHTMIQAAVDRKAAD